ncbi:MAG: glycosyltransferase family 39 protein, partial [Chloroflexota bacterium]|nr:glycosyltransferase family 39 protein [Chloroflexota bacterium]
MKIALGCLLVLFGVLGLSYSLVTPVFEAPDEVWHYAYVRYLAEERALPALTGDASGAHQEVAQPPLYYAIAALVSGLAPDDDLPDLMWHNPGFGYQAGGAVNDNKNMLIHTGHTGHTGRERFPWRGAVLAIRLARFVSLGFGLLTVFATWGLGREAFPQRPALALGVAAVVAFHPQFLFISGVASNDSAAAALSTAALWAIARILNRGSTIRRSVVIGLLLGLAALTKTSTLLLIPLATIALALAPRHSSFAIRHSPLVIGHWTLVIGHWSLVIRHWSLVIGHWSLIGAWWYIRNAILYGDPFGFRVHTNTL